MIMLNIASTHGRYIAWKEKCDFSIYVYINLFKSLFSKYHKKKKVRKKEWVQMVEEAGVFCEWMFMYV